jgi:hypothetical protein
MSFDFSYFFTYYSKILPKHYDYTAIRAQFFARPVQFYAEVVLFAIIFLFLRQSGKHF